MNAFGAKLLLSAGVVFCFAPTALNGVELVRDGRPAAEIVVPGEPMPQVSLAASELQAHIRLVSGAVLPIVTRPGGTLNPVFVGESEYTRQLGLTLADIAGEGYKIVAAGNYLALFGRDAIFPFYPRDHRQASDRPELLEAWQAFAGEKFDFPWLSLYDPRHFNPEFGFSLHDPSGTLFAVYEFLEQLGIRWYLPYHDFGTVIPTAGAIFVRAQDITRRPAFARRFLRFGWGSDREVFLWSKRQKLGLSEMAWLCHGTSLATSHNKEAHPEYLAVVGGRLQTQDGHGPGQSRLAAPLRDAMIRFGTKFFDRYPELRHFSAAPNDGYVGIDDRDRAAGWLREQYGSRGELSDYAWTFINEVAEGVAEKHPGKFVMGLAYSRYRMPPRDFETMHPALGVTYCQTRAVEMIDPEKRREIFAERDAWLRKLPSGEFYLWEYYLQHLDDRQLPGVPVVFTRIMREDAQNLRGKSKGEYIEMWGNPPWGLSHLTAYLQARLYWEPDLDLDAFLDEYCRLFYGPAATEMREFLTFAEAVWMRPKPRNVQGGEGFLQPGDIERYFEILARAAAKAGESGDYARRVALVTRECQPMRLIFTYPEHYEKGREAARAGDGATAEKHLKQAVEAAQDHRSRANAAFELGNVYRNLLKDNEQALEAYRLTMAARFSGGGSAVRAHARMNAVAVLRQMERYDEALKLLDEFDENQQHDYWLVESLRARGQVAEDRKQPGEALEAYRKALSVEGITGQQADAVRRRVGELER